MRVVIAFDLDVPADALASDVTRRMAVWATDKVHDEIPLTKDAVLVITDCEVLGGG